MGEALRRSWFDESSCRDRGVEHARNTLVPKDVRARACNDRGA